MSYEFEYSNIIKKDLKKLPREIIDQFRVWIETIKQEGLDATRQNIRYNDRVLKGRLKGLRRIRLKKGYRVIYKETRKKDKAIIFIKRISKHDYRQK